MTASVAKLIELEKKIQKNTIGCSLKFPVKVGVEKSIVNALLVCHQLAD
jgi:hypothetical protein